MASKPHGVFPLLGVCLTGRGRRQRKKSENVEHEPSGTQELGRGWRLWERGAGPLLGARRERAESQGGIAGFVLGGQGLREERSWNKGRLV